MTWPTDRLPFKADGLRAFNSNKLFCFFILFLIIGNPAQEGHNAVSSEKDRDSTAPLNLSSGIAEDKRTKRSNNDVETVDLAKRVKTEQTEATDLSMKSSSSGSSQLRLGNHSVVAFLSFQQYQLKNQSAEDQFN